MTMIRTGDGNVIDIDNPLPTKTVDSTAITPIDVQSRLQQTIQTHNAVSIPATTGQSMNTSWIDADGFDKVSVTAVADASSSGAVQVIWSNDGTTIHYYEQLVNTTTSATKGGITDVKARYFKVNYLNYDAAAHTVSAYAYLKA